MRSPSKGPYHHLFLAVGVPYTRLINLENLFELLPDSDSRTCKNVLKVTRAFLEVKQSSVGDSLATAEVKAAQRMWHRLVSGGPQRIAACAAPQPLCHDDRRSLPDCRCVDKLGQACDIKEGDVMRRPASTAKARKPSPLAALTNSPSMATSIRCLPW